MWTFENEKVVTTVLEVIKSEGYTDEQAERLVLKMQESGIMFREYHPSMELAYDRAIEAMKTYKE